MKATVSSQTTSLTLLWAPSLLGSRMEIFVLLSCLLSCVGKSQLIYIYRGNPPRDPLPNSSMSEEIVTGFVWLVCFFNKVAIWLKCKQERVNNNIEKGMSLTQKPSLRMPE